MFLLFMKIIVWVVCVFGFLLVSSIVIVYANKKLNLFSSLLDSIDISNEASQRLDNITRKILSNVCKVEVSESMFFIKITDENDSSINDTVVINTKSKFFGCTVSNDYSLVLSTVPNKLSKTNFRKALTEHEIYKSFKNAHPEKYEKMFNIKNEKYDNKTNIILE